MLCCAELCLTLCNSMDNHQAPLSLEFSRQEYWSGLPFPTPGNLPKLGLEPATPASPALQILYLLSHMGSPTWGLGNYSILWQVFQFLLFWWRKQERRKPFINVIHIHIHTRLFYHCWLKCRHHLHHTNLPSAGRKLGDVEGESLAFLIETTLFGKIRAKLQMS